MQRTSCTRFLTSAMHPDIDPVVSNENTISIGLPGPPVGRGGTKSVLFLAATAPSRASLMLDIPALEVQYTCRL